jgi:hypothetical protein
MPKFADDDPRADLTDLFVFASPQSPANTASVFDVNPLTKGGDCNPKAACRLNIATDGDVQADAALSGFNAGYRIGE